MSVPRGSTLGIVGENGAGKSTLIQLIMGFVGPTAGTISVLGHTSVQHAHPRIGYVHERQHVEPELSPREHLASLAALSGLHGDVAAARIAAVLDVVGLTGVGDRRLGGFSKGMLQRLAIAGAVLADPALIILDEPTDGLDPAARVDVRTLIAGLRGADRTVFICSHDLAEIEALCDTVAILHHGRLVRYGSIEALRGDTDMADVVLETAEPAASVARRIGIGDYVIESADDRLRVPLDAQSMLVSALIHAEVPLRSVNPVRASLESVYLRAIAGEHITDAEVSRSAACPKTSPLPSFEAATTFSAPRDVRNGVVQLWLRPTAVIARRTLTTYARSGWMLLEIGMVGALVVLATPAPDHNLPSIEAAPAGFYTQGLLMLVVAIVGPLVMVRRTVGERAYALLARMPHRAAYPRGLLTAAALLRLPLLLELVCLALLGGRLPGAGLEAVLIGGVGLLSITVVTAALTVTLCSPWGTRRTTLSFLAWLLIALLPNQLVTALPTAPYDVISAIRLPVQAVAPATSPGVYTTAGWVVAAALAVQAGIVLTLALTIGRLFERRDLVLR